MYKIIYEQVLLTQLTGERFLKESTEQRAGPKLAVGDACTSVAVDLGGLEGQYPNVTERWLAREKLLKETIDWQSFKVTSDHVSDACYDIILKCMSKYTHTPYNVTIVQIFGGGWGVGRGRGLDKDNFGIWITSFMPVHTFTNSNGCYSYC